MASTDMILAARLLLAFLYSSWIVVVVALLLDVADPAEDDEEEVAEADRPLSEKFEEVEDDDPLDVEAMGHPDSAADAAVLP